MGFHLLPHALFLCPRARARARLCALHTYTAEKELIFVRDARYSIIERRCGIDISPNAQPVEYVAAGAHAFTFASGGTTKKSSMSTREASS